MRKKSRIEWFEAPVLIELSGAKGGCGVGVVAEKLSCEEGCAPALFWHAP